MQLTWIDAIFFAVLVYFFIKGWAQGFLYLSTSLISFGFSLIIALRLTGPFSEFLTKYARVPEVWSGIAAYFLLAFIAQSGFSYILSGILTKTSSSISTSPMNRFIGSFFSGISGVFLFSLFLFFILLVPVQGSVKQAIRNSTIAPIVIAFIDEYGGPLPRVLSDSARKLNEFLTIQPDSKERITLRISVDEQKLTLDESGEDMLFTYINDERIKAGVAPLTISFAMREIARQNSATMLKQKYFAHVDPHGNDVGDRLTEAGVRFFVAGENLAYAPDIETAHAGLMDSKGHKKNILDPDFKRIGIGVIDAGIWGKMITQVFAD